MTDQNPKQGVSNAIGASRMNRRRFTQGVAATAAALGVAAPSISGAGAQEETTIKYWTHTHPPMVELNQALVKSTPVVQDQPPRSPTIIQLKWTPRSVH